MIPRAFLACVLFASLLGCTGDPVPQGKASYIGQWEAMGMSILIMPDGGVSYFRLNKGVKTTVNGPIQEFRGNDFVVGFWVFNTTFAVSKPPYQDNGVWKMVVDGVELTRTR